MHRMAQGGDKTTHRRIDVEVESYARRRRDGALEAQQPVGTSTRPGGVKATTGQHTEGMIFLLGVELSETRRHTSVLTLKSGKPLKFSGSVVSFFN